MTIKQHAIIGGVLALPLGWLEPWGACLFWCANILIDVDHLAFYTVHEGRLPLPLKNMVKIYKTWDYFGPRVNFFHNYETLIITGVISWLTVGGFTFIFLGVFVHLIADQLETYTRFRFLRIRTCVGDLLRYGNYIKARNEGNEDEYMVGLRSSWKKYLKEVLSEKAYQKEKSTSKLLSLYQDVPDNADVDVSIWKQVL